MGFCVYLHVKLWLPKTAEITSTFLLFSEHISCCGRISLLKGNFFVNMSIKKICWSRGLALSSSPPTVGRVEAESLKSQVRDQAEKSENALETYNTSPEFSPHWPWIFCLLAQASGYLCFEWGFHLHGRLSATKLIHANTSRNLHLISWFLTKTANPFFVSARFALRKTLYEEFAWSKS